VVVPTMKIPAAGAHGGDGARMAETLGLDSATILDLSQSLNPVASDPRPIVAAHLDALGRYPDPSAAHAALAGVMNVDPSRLLLTNGGAEAIALVASRLGGSVVEPEFSLHPRGQGPNWRSNPHSPSGLLAAPRDRAAVWDEAFYPLATGEWTRGDVDSVVVGSLTKVLACPGLRVGYVLASPSFIEGLRSDQPEWSLNGLAAEALPDLLAALDLPSDAARIRVLRADLEQLLNHYNLRVSPSDANWVLVDAPGLREALAPHGVMVRDCASFGLDGVMRIAVPNDVGRVRLRAALESISTWINSLIEHQGAS
jgi:histidinol-phosphate/aromatic aminotransferase/cobyric acid decarboxylase-like protein